MYARARSRSGRPRAGTGLAAALLLTSAGLAACADCDGNGAVDILDALAVARVAAQLDPLPVPTSCCDADHTGTIDILDALLMAQVAAQLPVNPSCAGVTVQVTTPAGPPVLGEIQYTLANSWSDPADILVEFSSDAGATWSPARRYSDFLDPETGLTTSPGGEPHRFAWDYFADLRGLTATGARIRISGVICGVASSPATTAPFSFSESVPPLVVELVQNQTFATPGAVVLVDPTGPGAGTVAATVPIAEAPLHWGSILELGPANLHAWILHELGGFSLAWVDLLQRVEVGNRLLVTGRTRLGGLALSPSGDTMALSMGDAPPNASTVRLFDAYERVAYQDVDYAGSSGSRLAYGPTDDVVWVTNATATQHNVHVVDLVGGSLITSVDLGADNGPNDVVYSPARSSMFVSLQNAVVDNGDVLEIDFTTRAIVRTLNVCGLAFDTNTDGLAVNPTGTILAATNANAASVTLFDTATGGCLSTIVTGNSPRAVTWCAARDLFYDFNQCDDPLCVPPTPTAAAVDPVTLTKVGSVDISPSRLPTAIQATR